MMRTIKIAGSIFTGLIAAATLAACGGGGSQPAGVIAAPAGPPAATAKTPAGPTAQVTVSVKIPARTPSIAARTLLARRTPAYVSSGTQSMAVFTQPSGASATVNCTTGLTCTLTVAAIATDTSIFVTLFDGQNGGGNLLSTQSAALALTAGVPSNVNLTLDGVAQLLLLSAPIAQLVVNYPQTFLLTTQFPDYSNNLIGSIGNVVDTGSAVILGGGGIPNNITFTYHDASITAPAPAFNAGPPYSLTQTVSYTGAQPATPNVTITAVEAGGQNTGSNVLSLVAHSPLELSTADTSYQLSRPALPAPGPLYSLEFTDLSAVSVTLNVAATFGALTALPTTLSKAGDTCTSGSFISALAYGPFSGANAPVTFTISALAATGSGGCLITLQDNAVGPGPNTINIQVFIDNAQIFIQGKKRK